MRRPLSGLGSGLLPMIKPEGCSSKDVVRHLGRLMGCRLDAGHVGTLDPFASGVLPLLFGRASRLQDFLLTSRKVYRFGMRLGVATDSLDWTGRVSRRSAVPPHGRCRWQAVASTFVGGQDQVAPLFSAIKIGGKRLCHLARTGDTVTCGPRVRRIEVERFSILEIKDDQLVGEVVCSRGTYVRTLATDLAQRGGTVGHLVWLARLETAKIDWAQCWTLGQIEKHLATCADPLAGLGELLVPVARIPLDLPRCEVGEGDFARLVQGQSVPNQLPGTRLNTHILCLGADGRGILGQLSGGAALSEIEPRRQLF